MLRKSCLSLIGLFFQLIFLQAQVHIEINPLTIPERLFRAESGSEFMNRIENLPLARREEEIFKVLAAGNIPGFLRNMITINCEFADAKGIFHKITYQVMPDYLSVGSDSDFCRIPMNPYTAQKLADLYGGSLLTAKLSDHIYESAEVRLSPFFYAPVNNENELVSKFKEHNTHIEKQFLDAAGKKGQLTAGIKKDVIITERLSTQPGRVVIYGWHKPDGKPIQPVYSGHVDWYVDYSHGIRFVNNRIIVDGKPELLSEILKDPVLFKLFSNEEKPMAETAYRRK